MSWFNKWAVPTTRGWVHSQTGELLKAQKMTEAEVAELSSGVTPVQTLTEAPAEERFITEDEEEHFFEDEDEDEDEEDVD